ncbi:MAG: acyl carrier protein [Oscillospiraceae bacterium]|nr:acyl carrier protein [Oscillospiraceae bacterium]
MNQKEIIERLTIVFCEVFDDDLIHISSDTTPEDIEGWDLRENINLIEAIEKEFSMQFYMRELSAPKSVRELIDIIVQRAGSRPQKTNNPLQR